MLANAHYIYNLIISGQTFSADEGQIILLKATERCCTDDI